MTFWKEKSLHQMSESEWESLCDGCGKCCLHKLQDEDTEEVFFSDVGCRMLDPNGGGCTRYADRRRWVASCVKLSPDLAESLQWLPRSCAYRRLAEGRGLADWHPLVSGDPDSVHRAGMSVKGRIVDERVAGAIEDHVVSWPDRDSDD
ncbi:YcgN family cysteine cluster protein [Yunchengibacter salinarum]|uniref:YcgN family cysteine cluster protein n=1 Tax=Yunchengibacter salinarum TaxID=3133399 RepID=UPI0035B5836D